VTRVDLERIAGTAAAVVTAAVLAGLLSSCYPHSHEYVLTPEFSGVLFKAGTPMPGVTVTVSHTRGDAGDYCINPKTVAVTDGTGAFRVPPQTSTHHFASLLNAPETIHQMTSICFQALGNRKLGALVLAPTDHEERFEMVCDWESPAVEFKQKWLSSANQWGICKRRDSVGDGTGSTPSPAALIERPATAIDLVSNLLYIVKHDLVFGLAGVL
jgi:hypothetical protein